MGVTQNAKPIVRSLRRIAEFLNVMGPGATQAHWNAFLKEVPGGEQAHLGSWCIPWDEAKKLRRQIHHDLAFLRWRNIALACELSDAPDQAKDHRPWTDDERAFFRADAPLERPFDDLVDRLNKLEFKTVWQYQPLAPQDKPSDPSQATLEFRWKDGTTGRWATHSWMSADGLQGLLYAVLGKALESGLLSRLRTCQLCNQYLVVTRVTKQFCPGCKVTHHNHNRPGYFQDRRAEIRADKIKEARALKRTLKLTLSDASVEILYEKTDLPRRVIAAEIFNKKQTGVSRRKTVARAKRAPRQPAVETREAIAARLQPVIAAYYKRMAKLDQKQPVRRATPLPTKTR